MRSGAGPTRRGRSVWLAGYRAARGRGSRRGLALTDWPASLQARRAGHGELTGAAVSGAGRQPAQRRRGLEDLLDWLEDQDGDSWQQRWLASGAEAAGSAWLAAARRSGWQPPRRVSRRAAGALSAALITAVCARHRAPVSGVAGGRRMRRGAGPRHGRIPRPAGLRAARRTERRRARRSAPRAARTHTLRRAAVILAAKGGMLARHHRRRSPGAARQRG